MASQGATAANSRLTQMQEQLIIPPVKLSESWAGRRLVEALSHLPPADFNSSLDMRFQQKQQQEREQRRLGMNDDGAATTADLDVVDTKRITNGKVRQMFDERRRGAGIDRANPLKPITTTTKAPAPAPVARLAGGAVTQTKTNTNVAASVRLRAAINARNPPPKRLQNGNSDNLTKEMSSLSLGIHSPDERNNNNMNRSNDTLGRAKSSNNLKLNPIVTRKSPSTTAPQNARGIAQNTSAATRQSPGSRPSSNVRTTTTRVTTTNTLATKTPPRRTSNNMANSAVKKMPSYDADAGNMGLCQFCNRHFNMDRLAKHEQVCEKMAHTKRKIFDAARHRLRGTDAEKFLKKAQTTRKSGNGKSAYSSAAAVSGMTASMKKNNWRKKHEEFIQAIRAAKQVQAHLARGGKLSDLPPPPPSENPDYIQCPHCLRRFNESAAERHIPRCATMIHNKPKPGQQPPKRR